jgi:hypothetical protein
MAEQDIAGKLTARLNTLIQGKGLKELVPVGEEHLEIPLEYGWLLTIGDGILAFVFTLNEARIEVDLGNMGEFIVFDAQSNALAEADPFWVLYASALSQSLEDTLRTQIFSEKVLALPEKAILANDLSEKLVEVGIINGLSETSAKSIASRIITRFAGHFADTQYVRRLQRYENDFQGEAFFTEEFFRLITSYDSIKAFRRVFEVPKGVSGRSFKILKEVADNILMGVDD